MEDSWIAEAGPVDERESEENILCVFLPSLEER